MSKSSSILCFFLFVFFNLSLSRSARQFCENMRLRRSAAQIICASLISSLPVAHALSPRTEIADNYDFVVVGGGLAGLAIGGRLAEDTNHTVLVLEAGGNGDAYRDRIGRTHNFSTELVWRLTLKIDTPALAYFDSLWYTPLDWGFYTTPQPHVNDREVYWPRGKVLGGRCTQHSNPIKQAADKWCRQLCHQWPVSHPAW